MPVGTHRPQPKVPFAVVLLALMLVAGVAYVASAGGGGEGAGEQRSGDPATGGSRAPQSPGGPPGTPAGSTPAPQVDAAGVATPGPINPAYPGLRTFRGNYSRDYYGEGPVPTHPVVRWRFPRTGGLCGLSFDKIFGSRTWCGTGWTGQPNVIPMANGKVEVREGAYDFKYHFLNGVTGAPTRPAFPTQDLAKGSATSDSDGYPLYYGGSRDNRLRVIATDGSKPRQLWQFNSRSQKGWVWNDDWDAAPLQVGDYLLEGGENSWFYVIRLNRGYTAGGKVTVDPKIVMRVPGWDPQFRKKVTDADISIENSVAFRDGVAYFSNSGGLVQGWDISDVLAGGTQYKRVFRYWNGDDTDATIVIDPAGDLIVGRKMEENVPRPESFPRDHQVGSLMKLDPSNPADPLVWSVQVGGFGPDNGILGTPALYDGVVYAPSTQGGLVAVDEMSGKLLWELPVAPPTWSSPVPIDGKLILGDGAGYLNCWQLNADHSKRPHLLWRLHVGGIIESTPALWHGWIYVGTRDGGIYGIANRAR